MSTKPLKEIKQSDIFSHWTNIDYLPRWGVLLLDLLIAFIAFLVSYVIGSNLLSYNIDNLSFPIWLQVIILMIIQTIFFWVFHTYSGILRYSTFAVYYFQSQRFALSTSSAQQPLRS